MSSPEEKAKRMERLRRKRKARVRSSIAKDLITSGKYKQRIVKDKRGRQHDLNEMSHLDFVNAIQDLDRDE